MPLTPLTTRPSFEENPKLSKAAHNLSTLLGAIEKKNIPEPTEAKLNEIMAGVNNFPGPDPELLKQIKSAQAAILKLVENELGLVAKNHYQLQWLALGMATFGVPLGVVFGLSLGNMAFIGIGLPIGMAIGIAFGSSKDKQAEEQGKQLDWAAK
ncbi:hypothetical protein SAMN04489724_3662 [Algoriphagus locisalis]|uniref:Uncharacterized protein n=1 Tax=Algoriphagus locisalis TaxID=305507 RepID=A0A1I7D1D5_9BACT|nr:hypothetical protein [Algoriphagus locisalis]SFU05472.1 hypothetical protein SAMN04489724_3662 [Algoriphagus locisalis]